jgi:indole-3-glycerol phosphate synthase
LKALSSVTGTAIIAETKKASPSAGTLIEDYDPSTIAETYVRAGAIGISVLTEPRHFMGHLDHLRAVRENVAVPVLRKDFTCHPYHLHEACSAGADVVLLIVAALDKGLLMELHSEARSLGLETLVEIHSPQELDTAIACTDAVLGVNSRDLTTLKTDLQTARDMAGLIPGNRLTIAESGIRTRSDIDELEDLGYKGFLIGESLLRADCPAAKLTELVGK